jgi:tetratricopeptide (TPR) repeat protein
VTGVRRFHRFIRFCLILPVLAAGAAAESTPGKKSVPRSFEVRGILVPPEGVNFDRERGYVQLGTPYGPAYVGAPIGPKGKFSFKRLPAGTYLLTAFVPRLARAKRTIEIGPSLADPQGRIEVSVQMEPSSPRPNRYLVTVDQLAIPDDARSEYEKGLQLLMAGKVEKAGQHFERATEIAPRFGAAWNQLAATEYLRGNFSAAASHFREAETHLPGNYQALLGHGAALLAARDFQASAATNARAVEARPTDAQAQAQLGLSLLFLDRPDEAEVHLKKAAALDPANFLYPQLRLAEIYRRRNDARAMSRELEEFLKLHPDSAKAAEIRKILDQVRPLALAPEARSPH